MVRALGLIVGGIAGILVALVAVVCLLWLFLLSCLATLLFCALRVAGLLLRAAGRLFDTCGVQAERPWGWWQHGWRDLWAALPAWLSPTEPRATLPLSEPDVQPDVQPEPVPASPAAIPRVRRATGEQVH